MCSSVSYFVPHSQAAVETILYLCISDWNRTMPIQSQLSLTHASLGKLILCVTGLTSLINVSSLEAFSCHSMLHFYFAHCATLMPDWAMLFSSFSAARTNWCLDLSCHSVHKVETGAFPIGGVLASECCKLDFGNEGRLVRCLLR